MEMPFNAFPNRADPDQAALVKAASSGPTQLVYGNMIRYDPILVKMTISLFYVQT